MKHTGGLLKNMRSIGIIAVIALMGFSMAACDDGSGGASQTEVVTASSAGAIVIYHDGGSITSGTTMPAVVVTTNLPAPNNNFTLIGEGDSKIIDGLTAGQAVKVTGATSARGLNASVYGSYVYFEIKHW